MSSILDSNLGFFDWDFKELNTKEMFPHNLSWYPSRYIPQIPAMLINEFSKEGDSVLDPFCGSGTTLIESLRLGRHCIGFDINPVATFMSNVKIGLLDHSKITIESIYIFINEVTNQRYSPSEHISSYLEMIPDDKIIELRRWYHSDTLNDLTLIWGLIERQEGFLKDVLRLVFMSILIPCSGLENKKPYTYYADNVFPKGDYLKKDAFHFFSNKISRLLDGLKETKSVSLGSAGVCKEINVVSDDILTFGKHELIVTSPPYLDVTDYTSGFRLTYLWFDFLKDISMVRTQELGARWKRKRNTSYDDYMVGMRKTLNKICESLKDDGHLCLVIGESTKYQNMIIEPLTDYLINEIKLERQIVKERSVNQNYFLHPTGGVKKEDILVFRK
jgi:hypothetical protein